MMSVQYRFRALAAVALVAVVSGCATWEGTPEGSPYYESYGYPESFAGPGYYGPGYYQPGYYGGYWYGGGYYSPAYGGSYAAYPYYPGTHVVIVDREHPNHGHDHDRDGGGGDPGHNGRGPRDPSGPQPQAHGNPQQRGEPQHPFGVPDQAYRGNQTVPVGPGGSPLSGDRRPQGPRVSIPPQQQRPVPQQIYRQNAPPTVSVPRVIAPPSDDRRTSPPSLPRGGRSGLPDLR